jgi:hypothetical protein
VGFAAGAFSIGSCRGPSQRCTTTYAFVEEVLGINTNRSDFGLQAGYFITPSLGLRFLSAGWYTHGGIPYNNPSFLLPDHPDLYAHHDQIAKSENLSVGGGVSYVLSGSTEVSVSYLRSIYGKTGHKLDQGLGFGVSYSFSPERIIRGLFPPKPDVPVGPLGQ